MFADLRFVFRSLAKAPGFTLVAVATLALGIGAGTAMFSILDAVLLRPLTLAEPDRLVTIRELAPSITSQPLPANAAHYQVWHERARSFAGLGIASPSLVALNDADGATPVALTQATASFLPTLGIQPSLGRGFTAAEENAAASKVVVLSDRLWRARFHADPAVLGRTVTLDRVPHTIIGVLPPVVALDALRIAPAGYAGPDLIKPLVFAPEELAEKWGRHNYAVFARLAPGVDAAAATRELDTLGAEIARDAGESAELRGFLTPLHESIVSQSRTGLWLLMGAVGAVLLIGCVNLAGLLLARAERRRGEIALRVALGASRERVFRLALLEPLAIAALGGGLGLLLANYAVAALPRFAPANLPRVGEVALDPGIVGFALGLAALCGLLAGIVPAWQLAAQPPGAAIDHARAVAGGRTDRKHRTFVAVQIALSFVLLASAALLIQSFSRLLRVDPGYRATHVLAAQVILPGEKYSADAQRSQFYARLLERLAESPEIESAALTNQLPLQGETWIDKIWVLGDGRAPAERPAANIRFVSSDYFRALGLPILAGRTLDPRDRGHDAVILSQSLAQTLFPKQDAVGRRITRDGQTETTVVGVVADVRADADRQPAPTLYRLYTDWPPYRARLVLRPRGASLPSAATLRRAIQATDPDVAIAWTRPFEAIAAGAVAPQRFQTALTTSFAGVATALTALGLYGIVAYAVACRRREFGVRLALGAEPASLPRTVVRQYFPAVALGLGAGVLAFFGAGRVLESLLFESNPRDPLLLLGVSAVVVAVCGFAAWLPARRTAQVDPMLALRTE
ncbi:MAG: ABC transporter permease [Opitutae bacterium]|nr:ABC transporter permease [Opitutae bacterium]